MPTARSASRTRDPAGNSSFEIAARRGHAATTSTRMELIGAFRKGVHHRVGDLVEERLEQLAQRAARELVAQREGDLASVLIERREVPVGGELLEGAFDQPH